MFIAQPGVEKLESQAFEMYSQVQNYLSWTLLNVGGERVGHQVFSEVINVIVIRLLYAFL